MTDEIKETPRANTIWKEHSIPTQSIPAFLHIRSGEVLTTEQAILRLLENTERILKVVG